MYDDTNNTESFVFDLAMEKGDTGKKSQSIFLLSNEIVKVLTLSIYIFIL